MKRLHRFFLLAPTERRLLARATLTVAAIRIGLWVLPFRTLRRVLARTARETCDGPEKNMASIEKVSWAVGMASRIVPRATCLTQALAAQVLLARQGCPATLTIGVAKSQQGQLEAHAWVEIQGRIVIGKLTDLSRFTPLPPLDGDADKQLLHRIYHSLGHGVARFMRLSSPGLHEPAVLGGGDDQRVRKNLVAPVVIVVPMAVHHVSGRFTCQGHSGFHEVLGRLWRCARIKHKGTATQINNTRIRVQPTTDRVDNGVDSLPDLVERKMPRGKFPDHNGNFKIDLYLIYHN